MNISLFIKEIKQYKDKKNENIYLRDMWGITNKKCIPLKIKGITIKYVSVDKIIYDYAQYEMATREILINKKLKYKEIYYFILGHEVAHYLSEYNKTGWNKYFIGLNSYKEEMIADIVGLYFYSKQGFKKLNVKFKKMIYTYRGWMDNSNINKVYKKAEQRIKKFNQLMEAACEPEK